MLVVLALLTVGGGGALLALKLAGPKAQAGTGVPTTTAAPLGLETAQPVHDEPTRKPVDPPKPVETVKVVDTAKPAETTTPAETAATPAPTIIPKGPRGGHPGAALPVAPQPVATPPPPPPAPPKKYDPNNPY